MKIPDVIDAPVARPYDRHAGRLVILLNHRPPSLRPCETAPGSPWQAGHGFANASIRRGFRNAGKIRPSAAAPSVPNADKAVVKRLEVDVKNLQATIAKMETDRDEMFANSQRRVKDFEAFKTRAERERKETFQNQISNIALLMLPALDNLQRALDSAEHLPGEKSDTFQQFYDGIALVSEQIDDILNKMGIKPITAVGEEFDPHMHEAVATDDTGEYPPNTISGEILRGYMAGDRVIRHSLVKVAMAGSAKPASEETIEQQDEQTSPAK
jgi:molecular chaperone GrpE